jgi:hypothetical protein
LCALSAPVAWLRATTVDAFQRLRVEVGQFAGSEPD